MNPSSGDYFTFVEASIGDSDRTHQQRARACRGPLRLTCAVRCRLVAAPDGIAVCRLSSSQTLFVVVPDDPFRWGLYEYPRLPDEWTVPQRIFELFGRRRLGTIYDVHAGDWLSQDYVSVRFDEDLFPEREVFAELREELEARAMSGHDCGDSPSDQTRPAESLDPISAITMRGRTVRIMGWQLSWLSAACPDLQFPREQVLITRQLIGRRVSVFIPGQTTASQWGLAAHHPNPVYSEPHALVLDDRLRTILDP